MEVKPLCELCENRGNHQVIDFFDVNFICPFPSDMQGSWAGSIYLSCWPTFLQANPRRSQVRASTRGHCHLVRNRVIIEKEGHLLLLISWEDQRRNTREASKNIPSRVRQRVQMMVGIRRGAEDAGIIIQALLRFQTRVSSIQVNTAIAIPIPIPIAITIGIGISEIALILHLIDRLQRYPFP